MHTTTLDVSDLAYAAGFIDGEGCFGLYESSKKAQAVKGKIIVCQKKPEVCYWFQRMFGFGTILKERAAYTWNVNKQSDMIKLINLLDPHLKIKRREARMLRLFARLPSTRGSLIQKARRVLCKEIKCEKHSMQSHFAA